MGVSFALTGSNPYALGTVATLANRLALVSGAGCGATASISGSFTTSEAELAVPPPGLLLTVDSRPFPFVLRSELDVAPVTVWFRNETDVPVTVLAASFSTGGWGSSNTANCITTLQPGGRCWVNVSLPGTVPCLLRLRTTGGTTVGQVDIVRG